MSEIDLCWSLKHKLLLKLSICLRESMGAMDLYNIFTTNLFWVVVDLNVISFYFIKTSFLKCLRICYTLHVLSSHFLFYNRFKYCFGSQYLAFMSNWFLSFQVCQIGHQSFNFLSKWFLPLSVGRKVLTWLTVYF